jgi:hypothetical protein
MKRDLVFFSSDSEALQYLANITQSRIKVAVDDWHGLPKSDDMYDQLEAIYELEYKYHQIKNGEANWTGNPKRYDNTLKAMGDLIKEIAADIAGDLLGVFENWLENHALLSAEKWAKKRVESIDDYGEASGEEIYQAVLSEYKRYKNGNFKKDLGGLISNNINNMQGLSNWLDEYGQEEKNYRIEAKQEEDGDDYDEEAFEEELEYLDDPEEVWHMIMDNWGDEAFNQIPEYLLDDFAYYAYKDLIFPYWLEHWKSKGIEETRKRVKATTKIINQIASQSISDVGKVTASLNRALNEAHQTGSMMDYVSEQYNVGETDLDNLSNMDVSAWNKELKKMGLKVAKKEIAMEEMYFNTEDEALQALADATGKKIHVLDKAEPTVAGDEESKSAASEDVPKTLRDRADKYNEIADEIEEKINEIDEAM